MLKEISFDEMLEVNGGSGGVGDSLLGIAVEKTVEKVFGWALSAKPQSIWKPYSSAIGSWSGIRQ